eukprot:SAG31_NODE_123_length_23712_cov_41.426291_36_plen_64_part_00
MQFSVEIESYKRRCSSWGHFGEILWVWVPLNVELRDAPCVCSLFAGNFHPFLCDEVDLEILDD